MGEIAKELKEIIVTDLPKTASDEDIYETAEFFNFLFEGNKVSDLINIFKVATSSTKQFSKYYDRDFLVRELTQHLVGQTNYYFSYNCFYKHYRHINTLNRVGVLALDVDAKDNKFDMNTIKNIVTTKLDIKPNYIVHSGNGLHIYYALESFRNASAKIKRKKFLTKDVTKNFYDVLVKSIASRYKKLGIKVDKAVLETGASRILRIPNTYNLKQGPAKKCKIIYKYLDNRYLTQDIKKAFKEEYEEEDRKQRLINQRAYENWLRSKEIKKKLKRQYKEQDKQKVEEGRHTWGTLESNRRIDLKRIVLARGKAVKGHRKHIMFYYLVSTMNLDKSGDGLRSIKEYNQIASDFYFTGVDRWDKKKIEGIVKYVYSKCKEGLVKYSNANVIEKLEITTKEQELLKTFVDAKEKKKKYDKKYREENKELYVEHNKEIHKRHNEIRANKTAKGKDKRGMLLEKEKLKYEKKMSKYDNSSKNIFEKNRKKAIQDLKSDNFKISEIALISNLSISMIKKILI